MKLSEIIAMVEEWLGKHTYNYMIYKIETDGLKWLVRFYEYSPLGNIECDTYFLVPYNERRIYNFNENDVLSLGRDANGVWEAWTKWYDEFEKKWRYGE